MSAPYICFLHASADLRWKDELQMMFQRRLPDASFENFTERIVVHSVLRSALDEADLIVLIETPNLQQTPFIGAPWREAILERAASGRLVVSICFEASPAWFESLPRLPSDGTPISSVPKHMTVLVQIADALAKQLEARPGRVTTFYSYKGGTGRSMALANIACLLGQRKTTSRGVLMIDWDLEAPGLHRFFEPHLPDVYEERGLIDLFGSVRDAIDASDPFATIDLDDYCTQLTIPNLTLMAAGRFDSDYASRVARFAWDDLFAKQPAVFEHFIELVSARFDHVLIDSRTGLNDTSGICTSLLPEQLVMVFTPNRQSLTGVDQLARKAVEYRRSSNDLRPLLVLPLPSRIEMSEAALKRRWRFGDGAFEGYQPMFERLCSDLYQVPECNMDAYFDDVQIQYVPHYAYGEQIAVLDEHRDRLSVSQSYEKFVDYLLRDQPPWTVEAEVVIAQHDVMVLYTPSVQLLAENVARQLRERSFSVWINTVDVAPGESEERAMNSALQASKAIVVIVGMENHVQTEVERLLSDARQREKRIVPVLSAEGGKSALPAVIRDLRYIDARARLDIDAIIWGITGRRPTPSTPQSAPSTPVSA